MLKEVLLFGRRAGCVVDSRIIGGPGIFGIRGEVYLGR